MSSDTAPEKSAAPCSTCRLRARYEAKPRSLLGRFWRWHTRWCPGWKGYLQSLSPEERDALVARLRL